MPSIHNDAVDQETYGLLQDLMGDEGFEQIIDIFYSDTQQAIKSLGQALNQQQADFVGGVCHKLKSSCQLIGASGMAQTTIELEKYTQHQNAELARQALAQLEEEFRQVKQWITSASALT